MVEIGHFKLVDKDKVLDRHKTDEETVIEGEHIDKISAEMIVEIEVDKISEETLAMIEIDYSKEAPHPEEIITDAITVKS